MCCTDSAIPGAYGAAAPMSALSRSLKASRLELGDDADWFRASYKPQANISSTIFPLLS